MGGIRTFISWVKPTLRVRSVPSMYRFNKKVV
nr:MAG TPA: hypothetical protein [Caudoviricetes sp.]